MRLFVQDKSIKKRHIISSSFGRTPHLISIKSNSETKLHHLLDFVMTALMVHHVALRTELLATHLTFERVIIIMDAHVNSQVLLFRETFATVRV